MSGPRKPKKTETIEVRIPHEVKNALMDKARAEGRSASEVIRQSIDTYLAGQPKEARSMLLALWKPAALVGAGSLALMLATITATPSQAKPDLKSVFHILDRNRDGAITMSEFLRDASDPSVEKMHHAHIKDVANHAEMAAMHRQMMKGAHTKASDRMLRSHFAQLDANSDGSVTYKEFQAFHERMKASHGAH
jgi:hypothetical protein